MWRVWCGLLVAAFCSVVQPVASESVETSPPLPRSPALQLVDVVDTIIKQFYVDQERDDRAYEPQWQECQEKMHYYNDHLKDLWRALEKSGDLITRALQHAKQLTTDLSVTKKARDASNRAWKHTNVLIADQEKINKAHLSQFEGHQENMGKAQEVLNKLAGFLDQQGRPPASMASFIEESDAVHKVWHEASETLRAVEFLDHTHKSSPISNNKGVTQKEMHDLVEQLKTHLTQFSNRVQGHHEKNMQSHSQLLGTLKAQQAAQAHQSKLLEAQVLTSEAMLHEAERAIEDQKAKDQAIRGRKKTQVAELIKIFNIARTQCLEMKRAHLARKDMRKKQAAAARKVRDATRTKLEHIVKLMRSSDANPPAAGDPVTDVDAPANDGKPCRDCGGKADVSEIDMKLAEIQREEDLLKQQKAAALSQAGVKIDKTGAIQG